jgi:hypothetical protein
MRLRRYEPYDACVHAAEHVNVKGLSLVDLAPRNSRKDERCGFCGVVWASWSREDADVTWKSISSRLVDA